MHWSTKALKGQRSKLNWGERGTLEHIDPYLVWFDSTGFAGVQLKDAKALQLLLERPGGEFAVEGRFFDAIPQLLGSLKKKEIRRFELSTPIAVPTNQTLSDALELRKRKVVPKGRPFCSQRPIVGFVDFGCAFANRQFRVWEGGKMTAKTRVAALWDQSGIESREPGGLVWSRPSDFGYGAQTLRDYSAGAERSGTATYLRLNPFMDCQTVGGDVDERRVNARSGHAALRRHATHGTHMMDVATGYPSPLDAISGNKHPDAKPHDADIVFVHLPSNLRGRAVNGMLRAHVLDAVRYILSCAPDKAEVIINLSYGTYCGPHDGTSMLEQAIDQEVVKRGGKLKVVVAAGNAFDKRLHAKATIDPGQLASFRWNNLPEDPTDSFVELWLPGLKQKASVRLIPPGQAFSDHEGWVGAGKLGAWRKGQDIAAALVYANKVCQGLKRNMVLVGVAPTATGLGRVSVPYGQWRVEVRNDDDKQPLVVDAWIERDDPDFGQDAPPRQSYFSDSDTAKVCSEDTLSSLAHGKQTLVVGGYVPGGGVARYSSAGQRSPRQHGATVLAPGDESATFPGLPATAVVSGDSIRLSGTSVAAAVVTRALLDGGQLPRPPRRPRQTRTPSAPQSTRHPDEDLVSRLPLPGSERQD